MMTTRVGTRLAKCAVAAVAVVAMMVMVTPSQAHAQSPATGIPVAGEFDGGTFVGTMDIVRFQRVGGVMKAVATLSGTLLDTEGQPIGDVAEERLLVPVAELSATCDILNLVLGPLDLDLLGLQVHLDRVVLDIVAEAGGGLLGSLLCFLSGLLDWGGALGVIVAILNRILEILSLLG
jgi:hypothetical protein